MNASPNILPENQNFTKLRHDFVSERAMTTTTLISSCHCSFLLAKEKAWKRIFKTNSELSQNRTEKQVTPSKTTANWLFNEIWCYLVIAYFDWKNRQFWLFIISLNSLLFAWNTMDLKRSAKTKNHDINSSESCTTVEHFVKI